MGNFECCCSNEEVHEIETKHKEVNYGYTPGNEKLNFKSRNPKADESNFNRVDDMSVPRSYVSSNFDLAQTIENEGLQTKDDEVNENVNSKDFDENVKQRMCEDFYTDTLRKAEQRVGPFIQRNEVLDDVSRYGIDCSLLNSIAKPDAR